MRTSFHRVLLLKGIFLSVAVVSNISSASSQKVAASSETSSITLASYQVIQAAVTDRIQIEFTKQILDQDMKLAILQGASSEDKLELQRLFATYKQPSAIESLGTRLRASDKNSKIVFEVAPPKLGEKAFLINGRAWNQPTSGSILQDLQRHLSPETSREKKTDSQSSERDSKRYFVNFAKLGRVPAFSLLTPPLQAQAKGSDSSLLPLYYFVKAQNATSLPHLYEMIKSNNIDAPLRHGAHFQTTGELAYIKAVFKGLLLSRYDVKCTRRGAEGYAEISGTKVEFVSRPDNAVQVKADGDNQWLIFQPVDTSRNTGPSARSTASDLVACTTSSCEGFIYDDKVDYLRYRIPPNNQESVVTEALKFKPTSSPASPTIMSGVAKIDFNCPTKNKACQTVALSGGESLSGEDLLRAEKLVSAANRALRWKKHDSSVVQPLEKLRVLGPCCEDTFCRQLAFEKGVNLIPQRERGTTK
jgi:hypothetical protein